MSWCSGGIDFWMETEFRIVLIGTLSEEQAISFAKDAISFNVERQVTNTGQLLLLVEHASILWLINEQPRWGLNFSDTAKSDTSKADADERKIAL